MIQFAFAAVSLLVQNPPDYEIPSCTARTYRPEIEAALYGNACNVNDDCGQNAKCYYRWDMCYGQTEQLAYLRKTPESDQAKTDVFNNPYQNLGQPVSAQISESNNTFPSSQVFLAGICVPFELMDNYANASAIVASLSDFINKTDEKSQVNFGKDLDTSCEKHTHCCNAVLSETCVTGHKCINAICTDKIPVPCGAAALSAAVSGVVAAAMLALVQL